VNVADPGILQRFSSIASETINTLLEIEDVCNAVNQFLKNPVQEIRTPGSVGVRATNWVASLPGGGG